MNTEQDVTVHQYLQDCGCDEEEMVKYLAYVEQGGIKNQIFMLVRHRKRLLNRLHVSADDKMKENAEEKM